MRDDKRSIRAGRRTADDPDAQLARLVMAGAPRQWLWRDPAELGIGYAEEFSAPELASDEVAAELERLRIAARRAALVRWWQRIRGRTARTLLRPVEWLRTVGRKTA